MCVHACVSAPTSTWCACRHACSVCARASGDVYMWACVVAPNQACGPALLLQTKHVGLRCCFRARGAPQHCPHASYRRSASPSNHTLRFPGLHRSTATALAPNQTRGMMPPQGSFTLRPHVQAMRIMRVVRVMPSIPQEALWTASKSCIIYNTACRPLYLKKYGVLYIIT